MITTKFCYINCRFLTAVLLFLLLSSGWASAQNMVPLNRPTYYPRVIRLQHSGAANGRLLASFDSGRTGNIYESLDNGQTWQAVAEVTETTPPGNCCSGLYEVPRQLGNTAAGTLFWSTSVGTDKGGRGPCSIRIYRSQDEGRTWSYFSTPVSGFIGLWEPEFAVDKQGRLVVYYSSEERKANGYNQMLAHKVSLDGGLTWGEEVLDVGMNDGKRRPGMPLVKQLPNGSFVMTYEICGTGCDTYIRTSPDGTNWGDPAVEGTRVESTAGHHFEHAPTLAWAPVPGKKDGQLLVIGQMLLNNADNTVAPDNGKVYMVNTTNGIGPWTEVPAPVPVPDAKDNPCPNYSSQLLPSADGLTVLEVALRMTENGCRAFYSSAPLSPPTPQKAPASKKARKSK
ncbi:sialidase/neuraminidase family protein [Hymenobacter radiodurans]|uniref:exo-alpha-sialidase n=1 Tax=Hymenobacter radiodurans TaxID=2496028 RepID=UPI001058A767|nr:exo-alpha-sialidase [Hymenobacter radiodurans]